MLTQTSKSLLLLLTTTTLAQAADLPPPWAVAALSGSAVPAVYVKEWKKAENRQGCAPLVLSEAQQEAGIKLRRANFLGGWAVAYDLPQQRSAFGIAGTGSLATDPTFSFPNVITWSEGSGVEYGLEGGSGPGYLAYLRVAGQSCLYNLWSKRGQAHLEQLIDSLRRVDEAVLH